MNGQFVYALFVRLISLTMLCINVTLFVQLNIIYFSIAHYNICLTIDWKVSWWQLLYTVKQHNEFIIHIRRCWWVVWKPQKHNRNIVYVRHVMVPVDCGLTRYLYSIKWKIVFTEWSYCSYIHNYLFIKIMNSINDMIIKIYNVV